MYNLPTSLPTSHLPYPPTFLPRARVCVKNIRNSENVRLPKVQKYSTLPGSLGLFFSFFGEKFIFAVDPVHCWSPLVRSHPFRIISHFSKKCYSIPVFNVHFQFLSFQSIEIDNCYILYISYMLTFKFILICHLFVFPNLGVTLADSCQRMISIF